MFKIISQIFYVYLEDKGVNFPKCISKFDALSVKWQNKTKRKRNKVSVILHEFVHSDMLYNVGV